MNSHKPARLIRSDEEILSARGARNPVSVVRPYHMLVEDEFSAEGIVEEVTTIFLTNRECPYRCLMCDLWKNTTTESVPQGAIPQQIRYALERLPRTPHLKLYNSGNFFDRGAVPESDHAEIADLVSRFRSVIVENHPKLCRETCAEFQQRCGTQLEVALGLETSCEETLATLNKRMTVRDFAEACRLLTSYNIRTRAFILLRPPGVSEDEGIRQALDSVRFAFECGVSVCAVIPVRAGNGIMDDLRSRGLFEPPTLRSLEHVIDEAVGMRRGRVLADLWDLRQFSQCIRCREPRIRRLRQTNLTQAIQPKIVCPHCDSIDGC